MYSRLLRTSEKTDNRNEQLEVKQTDQFKATSEKCPYFVEKNKKQNKIKKNFKKFRERKRKKEWK